MTIRVRVLIVWGLAVLAAFPAAAQFALGAIGGSVTYGSNAAALSGTVAYFDLRSGAFTPVVTSIDPTCPANTVRITATDAFASNKKALVAITANTGAASPPSCGTPDGLIVDNFKLVHTPQDAGPVV